MGEMIAVIMTIIGIIIYALNQAIEGNQQKQQQQQRREAQRQPAQRQQAQGRPAAQEDDVDAFLRDVARRRQGQQGQQQPRRPERAEAPRTSDEELDALRRRRTQKEQAEAQQRRSQQRRQASQQPVERLTDRSESRSTTSHQRRTPLSDRPQRDPLEAALADEPEIRTGGLSTAFAPLGGMHSLPSISDPSASVEQGSARGPDFSLTLTGLVTDPVALRRAFILQSILERPDDPFERRII